MHVERKGRKQTCLAGVYKVYRDLRLGHSLEEMNRAPHNIIVRIR